MLKLESERLVIIAATLEMAEAELLDRNKLEKLVGAKFPPNWPPPLNDENSMRWFLEYLAANPDDVGWVAWYICLKMPGNRLAVIGGGGFKGKPDETGIVEIGYSIMEEHQRKGYAPEAVKALTAWAFGNPNVNKVVAQTYPELIPSQKVLTKCGFKFVGDGYEEKTILFEILKQTK
jgi:[ribosomal protein S5]-alanine N-acetyltransferase